jgi:hypothetical protein
MRRVELAIQLLGIIAGRNEQVPIEAREVTLDRFVTNDSLDPVDGRRVALGRQPGSLMAVELFEVVEAIVESRHQMRGRAACLAARRRAIVQDDNGLAFFREQVGGGQPRNSCAHDAHVGAKIGWQLRLRRGLARLHPYGCRSPVIGHLAPHMNHMADTHPA